MDAFRLHLSYDEGLPGIWGKQRNAVNLTGERREHEISGTREQSESFEKSTGTRKGPFIIYTSGGHRREIKKNIYKKITQPLWVFKFFLPTSNRNPRFKELPL